MGSHINFKNYVDAPLLESGSGGKQTGNFPLARQSSIYSLTFDEFHNTYTGPGKDFGSMNMDELLKNICTAEATQGMTYYTQGGEGSVPGAAGAGGNLQRQGSLTLPRTLSQKTVDEVWRELLKENSGGGGGATNLDQRQQTLGEMTLEEFLARAGVVREDTQPFTMPTTSGLFGELLQANNNAVLASGLQPPGGNSSVLASQIMESNSSVPNQFPILGLNASGVRPSQQQKQIFPKHPTVAFASPVHKVNNGHLASPGMRGAIVGIADPSMDNSLVQGGRVQNGGMGMAGLQSEAVTVAAVPLASQISSHVVVKSNADTLSPSPYAFNGGSRGRKGGAVEKVIERRQRRMIKNRESAARSRARKQAYTLELEAEIAKLKELNDELQKKQAEIVEMHKNQIMEIMTRQCGGKKRCLRRTLTGPW